MQKARLFVPFRVNPESAMFLSEVGLRTLNLFFKVCLVAFRDALIRDSSGKF